MVSLDLNLDCWGSETSWDLTDAADVVLYSGSGYIDNNPVLVEQEFCLAFGCYNFTINDVYGDGMSSCSAAQGGNGSYQLVLQDSNGCLYPSTILKLEYPETVNVFPNPMKDFATIVVNTRLPQNWDYSIIDVWGNRVLYGEEENQTKQLDIRYLAKGVYTLIVNTKLDNQKYVTKLVKD